MPGGLRHFGAGGFGVVVSVSRAPPGAVARRGWDLAELVGGRKAGWAVGILASGVMVDSPLGGFF